MAIDLTRTSATRTAGYPSSRPRRLRQSPAIRRMVRETLVTTADVIYPLFVRPGSGLQLPIRSMPGQFQWSIDRLVGEVTSAAELGIPAVMLFGIPEHKDELGSANWSTDGIIPKAIRAIKEAVPEMVVISDMCLCEYTDHGHCGAINHIDSSDYVNALPHGYLLNDPTLELLAKSSVAHAQAGADVIAPSGMIDGMVGAIRTGLDRAGFDHVLVMSYAAKYASGFYGPFREAAESPPQFGDRSQYQMDPGNRREALKEAAMDIEEGADVVMVKPAMPYLDVLSDVRRAFTVPVAAYQVSGEYAMLHAAAANGWIDLERTAQESLIGIERAGADMILTYFAKDVARWSHQQMGAHDLTNNRFLRACRRESVDATPIWLMRQAGRYMPEYRALRQRWGILDIIKQPELACEVTLQPIEAFDLDAAIIFADILPPLEGMGLSLEFVKGEGPLIHNPVRTALDIDRLRTPPPEESLPFTLAAIRLARKQLDPLGIPLIGFSGAPFTLASYAAEGGPSKHLARVKAMMMNEPELWHAFMTKLATVAGEFLLAQANAGAHALQLFDSWCGELSPRDYEQFVLPYTKRTIEIARAADVPIILFGVGTSALLELMATSGAGVIGVDWRIDLAPARARIGPDLAVQGNLDPIALLAGWPALESRAQAVIDQAVGRPGHIFNLGHGVLQQTPVENVKRLVDFVHTATPAAQHD